MKKRVMLVAVASLGLLISSCGSKSGSESSGSGNTDQTLFKTVNFYKYNSSVSKDFRNRDDANATFTSMTLNISCPNSLPGPDGTKTVSWTSGDVIISAATPTMQIVKNAACAITLKQYIDASTPTVTFVPDLAATYLVVNVDATGTSTLSPAILYKDSVAGTTKFYFAGGTPTAPYSIAINYATTPAAASAPVTPGVMQTLTLAGGAGAPAPVLTTVNLTKTPIYGSTYYDYSLAGTVTGTGTLTCETFNTSAITAFDYKTVDTAFSTSGTACPANILSGTQANLNSFISGVGKVATTIIWANTVAGTNAKGYSYINVAANP